eukprot:scaffold239964_cov33-Tisochrysis_lutea.AAC.1
MLFSLIQRLSRVAQLGYRAERAGRLRRSTRGARWRRSLCEKAGKKGVDKGYVPQSAKQCRKRG